MSDTLAQTRAFQDALRRSVLQLLRRLGVAPRPRKIVVVGTTQRQINNALDMKFSGTLSFVHVGMQSVQSREIKRQEKMSHLFSSHS